MTEMELSVRKSDDVEEIKKVSISDTLLIPRSVSLIPPAFERWQRVSYRIKRVREMSIQNSFPTNSFKIRRPNKLREIFFNKCDDAITVKSIVFSFSGIFLSVISTLLINLWPQHNVIEEQKYWYESTIILAFGWGPIAAANVVNICLFCVGTPGKNSLVPCIYSYIAGAKSMFLCAGSIYLFWTYLGGLLWPMPFQGYISGCTGWYVMTITLWFQYPNPWRTDPCIRKKILYGILFLNVMVVAELTYKVVLEIFQFVPSDWQWTLVFLLFLVREWHSWILSYLGHKISGSQDLSVEVIAIHYAAVRHIIFLSVNLGGITTNETAFLMFGCDFITNLICCAGTMWLRSNTRSEEKVDMKLKIIMTHIINEAVEFVMPIAYCLCFIIAYFGPNASLMGNVKNGSWQFTSVDDIDNTLRWNTIMFTIDLASTLLTFILLRCYSKINILKMFLQLQDKMWYMLAIQQGYIVAEVRYDIKDHFQSIQKNLYPMKWLFQSQ